MKSLLICIMVSAFVRLSHSQNMGNVWYFGTEAGIDFNDSVPVALTDGALSTSDNSAAVANQEGELLFYTNGTTVWNRNHQIMPNGSGLMGSTTGGQTAMIIPQPGSNYFYIFTVPEYATSNGLRYSIVDSSLDSGKGDVIEKNTLLYAPATEKLAAYFIPADQSYWLIAHEWNTNNFTSYRIDANGLNAAPVISSAGSIHSGGSWGSIHDAMGQLTFSQDGTRIACATAYSGLIELFDFDLTTGILSNPLTIPNIFDAWGVEFSPDGSKLYATMWWNDEVLQFNLSDYVDTAVINSEVLVGNVTTNSGYKAGYLKLAPDGKIYVAKWGTQHLSIIENPDSLGTQCNFVDDGFDLVSGSSTAGLCMTPVYSGCISSMSVSLGNDTALCTGDFLQDPLTNNYVQSYLWSDGSTDSTYIIDETGEIWVQVYDGCAYVSDTIFVGKGTISPLSLGNDTIICEGETITLDPSANYEIYQWSTGSSNETIIVDSSGTYSLTAYGNGIGCAVNDSIQIEFVTCTGTGSGDLSNLKLYYHPDYNSLIVILPATFAGDLRLRIVDVNGRIVQENNFLSNTFNSIPLDENLSSGIYIAEIFDVEKVITNRFMVVNER